MKIIELKAENIKKIKAVEIKPKDNLIVIVGKNGAGKSSILDCISYALGGKDAIQSEPLRHGAEKGKITLDLEKFIVERSFTPTGTYLQVTNKDGAKYPSPQAMLDGLLGSISFDPLEFVRLSPKEQSLTLRKVAKIDFDFEGVEKKYKQIFDERTFINRDVKNLEVVISNYNFSEFENLPAETINIENLSHEKRKIETARKDIESVEREIYSNENKIKETQEKIEELQAILHNFITKKENYLKDSVEFKTKLEQKYNEFKAFNLDEAEIDSKIVEAANTNAKIEKFKMYQKAFDESKALLESKQSRVELLTNELEKIKADKQNALINADLPINNLSISEGGVYYNSVPLEQCSTAEQIRVSTAIAIASNPKLKVIRIKDGSLLDEDSFTIIQDLASKQDYQIWLERVGSNDPMAIIIEDGQVKVSENITPTNNTHLEAQSNLFEGV